MKKYIASTMAAVLFMLPVNGFCENLDWRDINYDFDTIKTVYINPEIYYGKEAVYSELERLKNLESVDEHLDELKKFKLTNDKKNADAEVQINVVNWGVQKHWVEPRDWTDVEEITRVDEIHDTKEKIDVVVFDRHSDGYYYEEEYFTAAFVVVDKSGQVIYKKADRRIDTKKAHRMFNRAVRDFYKSFNDEKW